MGKLGPPDDLMGKLGALDSGVARAYPGGRVTHLEGQNEDENLRKNKNNY